MVLRHPTRQASLLVPRAEAGAEDTAALPLNVLFYGREEPLPPRYDLQTGPLSVTFEQGQLLHLRWRGREVLRRIYVAVRDHDWGTVPLHLSEVRASTGTNGFQITFHARHQEGDIDFGWRGTIAATAEGRLTFAMDGIAQATFRRSRIGFCVLHAAKACAGRNFRVRRPDGSEVDGLFPEAIAQDAVIPGTEAMAALGYELAPGLRVMLRFEGDVFQMEDQRAWTDASFKSFCTPLELPCPVLVSRGTQVVQAVCVEVREDPRSLATGSTEKPVAVTVGTGPTVPLPAIGLAVASHGEPLSVREVERLRPLHVAHLRVDLKLWEQEWRAALQRAAREASQLGCPLEVGVFLTDSGPAELPPLLHALQAEQARVCRYIIFHRSEKAVASRWILLARNWLQTHDRSARFGGGTDANFFELTSFRPPGHGLDVVCFSMQPQAHAFDNASLVETLEMQGEVVRNARRLFGDRPVSVSPVTLKARFNPDATGPERLPGPSELPPQVDVRQLSLFAACWTLGSLKYLSESQAHSITYFETTGWRGVMEREAGSPLPAQFRSLPGAVFPLYHVLADVGEFAGGYVVASASSDCLKMVSLALGKAGRRRLLLGNMTGERVPVAVHGLATLHVQVKRLEAMNYGQASVNPCSFRNQEATRESLLGGMLTIECSPYSVTRVDWEGAFDHEPVFRQRAES
jgi:hypothetical protein